jgi:hypothetical protein
MHKDAHHAQARACRDGVGLHGLRRLVSLILQCGSLILHCEVSRLLQRRIFSQYEK